MQLDSRENELKKIYRYKGFPCNPMFYRPNLWIHTQRVEWISVAIAKQLGLDLSVVNRVRRIARYHDDDEIITGDILSMDKENFSVHEKTEYDSKCRNAISILVQNYGKELGDKYEDTLIKIEKEHKNGHSLEYSIVMYADKLDAHMEISHEIYAGNSMFTIILSDFGLSVTPYHYTRNKIIKLKNTIIDTLGKDVQNINKGLLDISNILALQNIILRGQLHTPESVKKISGNPLYDSWKELHFTKGTSSEVEYLYTQLEK